MDVSPETIRTVEFRERLRGYNQDDVDQFLERMAAGVEILQQRLRDANERAARAEQQAQHIDGDESLRRTLALAQRTADLAVQEAREQAARMIESAQAQGRAIVAGAEEQARQMANEARAEVVAEVARLEQARDQLRQDVWSLERFLDEERGRAHAALTEAARRLADLMPSVSTPPMPEAGLAAAPGAEPGSSPLDAPSAQSSAPPGPAAPGPAVAEPASHALPAEHAVAVEPAVPVEAAVPEEPSAPVEPAAASDQMPFEGASAQP